ncbi:putative retrotransposon hot spot protein (RHS,) [Trypanosoma cruzi]|uniref:Putative retrotransposon hot spot protein (RHS,) n=1 Tax=Trypanosoma cruzi TaxID=5693 RepID=A0A2V2VC63_TRYCR|nr:putative retrotransposon hot spot protein (RHS,) [Trypanosoma cruzi]
MRERTLRATTLLLLLAPTNTVLGGWYPAPSLRRSSCMWYASHTVWIALLFALLPVVSVPIGFILLFVCWLVFSFSSIKLIKQGETMSGRPETVHGGNGEGPASTGRKEMVGGWRGRCLRVAQINSLRLAEEWRKRGNHSGLLTVVWKMCCWRQRLAVPT